MRPVEILCSSLEAAIQILREEPTGELFLDVDGWVVGVLF